MRGGVLRENGETGFLIDLASSEAGAWDWDMRDERPLWSIETFRQFGLDPAGGVPPFREWLERCVHPEDHEHCERRALAVLAGDETAFKLEYRIVNRDQGTRWIASRGRIFRDASGNPLRMSGLNFDITEQKEIEDQLRRREEKPDVARQDSPGLIGRSYHEVMSEQAEARRKLALSEARFRVAFENAAVGMAQVGPDGAWLAVNKRLCEMLGYTAEELLAKKFQDVTHPGDLDANLAHVQNMLDDEADTYSMEKRYLRKDGSIFWARLTVGSMRKADRTIDYFISVVQDISERKRAETALRESEERLATALRAGKLGVYDYDPRTGLIEWDTTLRDLWGVSADEIVTLETFEAGLHPEDLPAVRAAMNRSFEPHGTRHYEAEYRVINRVDGSVRWVFADGDVFFDGETPCRMVGVAQDISERRSAKEQLRESEERLAAALRAGKLGVHDYDPRSGSIKWDPTLRRLWGVPDGEHITMETFEAGLHPEDLATVREAIARAFDPHGTRHYESEYRVINRVDGSVRWVFADGDVSFDGETPCRIVGIAQDITERRQAEEALRESEKRLRYALNAASAGTWDWDIRTGAAHWSPEDYALYGRDQAEAPVTYAYWESCLHPADREAANVAVSRALSGEVPEYRSEFRVVHPDGTVRWLLALGQVERAADGTPLRMLGINLDITERKLTEEALRASEERYRGIFQNAGTGIAIADLEGRFQSCNPAYARIIGYSLDELHALSFPDLVHPADRAENMQEIRRLVSQEIPSFEIVNRYIGKHGKPIWVHKHVSLLRDRAGTPASIISLVTDITERKQHEEQIALLLREVTHRSKNILSLVQAIAWHTAAKTPQEFVQRFDERIQALAASQDLLVTGAWNAADLAKLVKSQLAHFSDLIGARIQLRGPPLSVSASAAQAIGMAIHELATNAGKYGALSNASGSVEISWDLLAEDASEESFVMSWRESGGPPVEAPSRRGFGSTVICRMAEASLNAKVELNFGASGLDWQLRCLAKHVSD